MFRPRLLLLFLPIMIFYMVSISSILILSSPVEFMQAKPGCQLKCGNITIPYPFGIANECSMNGGGNIIYNVICDNSYDPPKLFMNATNYLEILSLSETEVRIRNSFTEFNGGPLKIPMEPDVEPTIDDLEIRNAFNGSGLQYLDLSNTPFMVSYTKNKLYGIGCGLVAVYIVDVTRKSVTGKRCQSSCENISKDESCSSSGCCQTNVPDGLGSFGVAVLETTTESTLGPSSHSQNFTSFAILAETGKYKFDSGDLTQDGTQISEKYEDKVIPVVLDWAIGYKTCEEAQVNSTTYGCQNNSFCTVKINGYSCTCRDGYEGNPYLSPGCILDMNECKDAKNNLCEQICTNAIGGYTCSCFDGGKGDGRKDGSGCTFHKKEFLVLMVALGTGLGFLFLLIVGFLLSITIRKREQIKLKEKFFQKNGGLLLRQQLSSLDSGVESTKIFTSQELEMATNKYDVSRVLGRGGHGTVYKGTLSDNRTVAIKKSNITVQSQIQQFVNEVMILTQINHRNVVKLLGCCLETEVPLLVYEYVSGGTLYQQIHYKGAAEMSFLTWKIRLRIAFETASAIAYLHSAASPPIIHRDIKSSNILLEENFTANSSRSSRFEKIKSLHMESSITKRQFSDFGASRLVPLDHTHANTLVQGTLGFLDPEYFNKSQLTDKSDVYSFGVVLIELLTGEKPICFERPEEQRNIATHFTSLVEDINVLELIDARVSKDENLEQILAVARRCL
ncbi:hypothetical protein MKX03_024797 [Papaver bracteatum]|nr:hypothetical protein MKX03_024797 [Papaver bracteatum]